MKFSVIIPVYNAEKYLRTCLDSALNQTESDWECVCIDDGSTDASGMILDEYAARDSRFKVIHQENRGVGFARNVGLSAVRGEWITWLDADDVYRLDRLAEARRLIRLENPDLVRFRTYMAHEDEERVPLDFSYSRQYDVREGVEAQKWGWRVLAPVGMVWTWVAKRDLLQGLLFPINMRTKEDSIFCGLMANRLRRVVQSEYVACFYRWTASSAIHCVRKADDCLRLLEAVRKLALNPVCSVEGLDVNVRKAMFNWLHAHAEWDIMDWIFMRHGERSRSCEILASYRELIKLGICDQRIFLPRRLRFPFWWWSHTGQLWVADIANILETFVRTVLRRN